MTTILTASQLPDQARLEDIAAEALAKPIRAEMCPRRRRRLVRLLADYAARLLAMESGPDEASRFFAALSGQAAKAAHRRRG